MKLANLSSVVYKLPFGKGRKFGSNWNPVFDTLLGGWELNSINTAHTGNAINVYYSPSAANDVTGLTQDWGGESLAASQCFGQCGQGT